MSAARALGGADVIPLTLGVNAPGMGESETLEQFAAWLASWGASERTVYDRTACIRAGLHSWGDPQAVTSEQLAAWLGQPRFSQWTKVTYYGHLRSFFGWLTDAGYRSGNPAAELRSPRSPSDRPRPLTQEQVARLLAVAEGDQRTWLLLGLLAGLRAHEVAKIRGQEVTEDAIYVMGKGRQGAMIPTHPELWALAERYPRAGYWFPANSATGHIHRQKVSHRTARLFASLGIDGGLQRCRHTYGTNLLRGGANIRVVQTLMRHKSLATTARYTAVDDAERMAAVRGLVA